MDKLLKSVLTEDSVSGNEDGLRNLILKNVFKRDVTVDAIGNVIVFKKGKDSGKKIMVCAQMDEAGFIVKNIDENGYLKFQPVGKIDARSIVSKKVSVAGKTDGIIGMKAIHLQKKGERENVVPASELFIDIGAKNKKDTDVKKGDYVSFKTKLTEIGGSIKGKGLSKICCAMFLEALKYECAYDTYFVFAAQNEVGMRGAGIAAERIAPDGAVVFGTCSSFDENGEKICECGRGAVIEGMDSSFIADRQLTEKIIKCGVKTQLKEGKYGMSGAGAVQRRGIGTKTVSVSIPCKYRNTPVEIISKCDIDDVQEALRFVVENKNLWEDK